MRRGSIDESPLASNQEKGNERDGSAQWLMAHMQKHADLKAGSLDPARTKQKSQPRGWLFALRLF